jgi:hypothetical protein
MSDPGYISGVWREATEIVSRYPLATIIPGAVLGGTAEVPHYFIEERLLIGTALTCVTAALAYYLYLAHAEEIAVEYERGMERITLRGMLRELWDATSYVSRALAAGLVTLASTSVATSLLVIPGAWLYTRWSLSIPAIRHENLGPASALKRSNALVRGRFWFIFATATLAFILEEAIIYVWGLWGESSLGVEHVGRVDWEFGRCGDSNTTGRLHHLNSIRTPHTVILVPCPIVRGVCSS